jgi:hypothetical protein
MKVAWTRLPDGHTEECASVSCDHAPALWHMDVGDTGSYFCDACRRKIEGTTQPTIAWYREAKSTDELIDFLASSRHK